MVVSVFILSSTNVHTELQPIGIQRHPLSHSNDNTLLLSLWMLQISWMLLTPIFFSLTKFYNPRVFSATMVLQMLMVVPMMVVN